MRVVYGNISIWGAQVEQFVLCSDADIWIFVEHRMSHSKLCALARRLNRHKLRIHASVAVHKHEGLSGGVMILSRSHLAVWPIRGAAISPSMQPQLGVGDDWLAVTVKLKKMDLLLCGVYLTCGIGLAGRNVEKVRQMAAFASTRHEPILWFGDWNMTPGELVGGGVPAALGGSRRTLQPKVADVGLTCTAGVGRIIDFGLCDTWANAVCSQPVPVDVPWRTHIGQHFTIRARPRSILTRRLKQPRRLEDAPPEHVHESVIPVTWSAARRASMAPASNSLGRVAHAMRTSSTLPGIAQDIVGAPLLQACTDWQRAASIGSAFERRGSAVDNWQCARARILPAKRDLYSGRLALPRLTVVPLVGRRGVAIPVAEWPAILVWSVCLSKCQHWDATERSIGPADTARRRTFSFRSGFLARAWQVVDGTDPFDVAMRMTTLVRVAQFPSLAAECRALTLTTLERIHTAEAFRHRTQESALVRKWAEAAVASPGAGQACKWLREPPSNDPAGYLDPRTKQVVHIPLSQAQARAERWQAQWSAKGTIDERYTTAMRDLRQRATEQAALIEPLTGADLRAVSSRVRQGTGLGSDGVQPTDFRTLPAEAWQDLAELLNSSEQELTFPLQVLLQVMGCIPKPDGSDRVIALVALVTRAWSKCRCGALGEWDKTRAGHWDAALSGHSALRAAAWRALGDESMAWIGGSVATVWLDVAKFFDSLDPLKLIHKLTQLEFPPLVLFMQLQLHWSTRIIRSASCVSQPIQVSRSVLAGSEASCSMARGYLYDICEAVSSRCPTVTLSTFVDDMVIRAEGTEELAIDGCVRGTALCIERLEADLLDVAPGKSICVASSVGVARQVQCRLLDEGHSVSSARAHRDLGVDSAGGRTRRTSVQTSRISAAFGRSRRLGILSKALKQSRPKKRSWASRLWQQAILPAVGYGHQLLGWAPSRLRTVRRMAAQACGFRESGRCLTSAIAIGLGTDRDPAVAMPCEVVFAWVALLHDPKFPGARVSRAWGLCLEWMREHALTRWRRATGPMSTTIAVLLDAGWNPETPDSWLNRTGERWGFDPEATASKAACAPLLQDLREGLLESLWGKAAQYRGGAAVTPSCAHAVRRQVALHLRHGRNREAGTLQCAAAGGFWPAKRKWEAGLSPTQACILCGHPEEDEQHLCWQCPQVQGDAAIAALDDGPLARAATIQGPANPSYWTR